MLNSRSIPADLWVYARKCLVFYFYRRHRPANAEDLAQETLMTIWSREDYLFEKEEDFLKICYGFARHILRQGVRTELKHCGDELSPDVEHPDQNVQGLQGHEVRIFLDEVRQKAEEELMADELALIEDALNREGHGPPVAPKFRVTLHRARKRLATLTGWRK
jgi:DNA-directed RNA polymerase specialized sigma24 family protein